MWEYKADLMSKPLNCKMGVLTLKADSAEIVDGSLYITRDGTRITAFEAPMDNEQYADNLRIIY